MRQTGKRETERVLGKRLLLIFDPTLIVFSTLPLFTKKNESVINGVFYSQPLNFFKTNTMTEPSIKFQGTKVYRGVKEAKNIGCSLVLWKPLLVGFCFVMGGIVQCLFSLLHYVIW